MKIDLVHDIQSVFRKIVDVHSFPGKILNINEEAQKINMDLPFSKNILLISMVLMDRESSFFCNDGSISEVISKITYGVSTDISNSDYVIAKDYLEADKLIANCRLGNLLDPHLGATLICELENIKDGNTSYTLRGPGIEKSAEINISNFSNIVSKREMANREFPMGIDIILLDKLGNILALPRTTQIKGGY